MGNKGPKSEYQICFETGKKRIDEYKNAPYKKIRNLYENEDKFKLRKGDIIRIINKDTISLNTGNDETPGTGLSFHHESFHFAIYVGPDNDLNIKKRYAEDQRHLIIQKVMKKQEDGGFIEKKSITTRSLQDWSLNTSSRYTRTCDMAIKILEQKLDLGFDRHLSNCEHFVTFCLTRNTVHSISQQRNMIEESRNIGSFVAIPVFGVLKMLTHPIYKIFGRMTYAQRQIQLCLPWQFDSYENVIAIEDGTKIWIGNNFKNPKIRWFPHD